MSDLKVRIDRYLDSEEERAPRVPARIYAMVGASKSPTSVRKALVPISVKPSDFARIDLAPGVYLVETVLPSGERLAESVTLADGETRDLVLQGERSPNEWFAWQDVMGNTRPSARANARPGGKAAANVAKRPAKKAAAPPKNKKPGGTRAVATATGRGASRAESVAYAAPPAVEPAMALGRPIRILSTPVPPLVAGEPHGAAVWKWLSDVTASNADGLVKTLNAGHDPIDLQVHTHDESRAVYRLTLQQTTRGGVQPLQGTVAPAPRYFAAVPRQRAVELLSLPLPWLVVESGREAALEVAVQQVHGADAFCASAVARDEELGMLLGFLSSGSLPTAREMAETARDMLYGKMANPYAAAAGGYALVATALEAEDREWHGWIRNLMASFPHIPDGAIQWAQLRLKMRRSASDMAEAKDALKSAYRRGLPFYSMGVKWLLEGLEWVAKDDPEAEEMVRQVRRLAWRTNFQQPFTILRIGGDAGV